MWTLARRRFVSLVACTAAAGPIALWTRGTACANDPEDMPIPRTPVDSTSIASVGYDAASSQLDIEFRTGALYRYTAVPPAIFTGLLQAASKGHYFTEFIRDHFEFRRLRRAPP